MATLHLICGLPCAGKTTLAKRLERECSALRLSPDEWHIRLFGHDFGLEGIDEEHDDRHSMIEALMWDVAARVLTLGTDVILDFGFWGRSEREDYRSRAAELGARSKVHFLNVPEEVLFERLRTRNTQRSTNTFEIPEAKLEEWVRQFQAPTRDELDQREGLSGGLPG